MRRELLAEVERALAERVPIEKREPQTDTINGWSVPAA